MLCGCYSRFCADIPCVSVLLCFFFSSRRRHTSCLSDWSSDVCSSDLLCRNSQFRSEWPYFLRRSTGGTDRKSTRLNSSHLGISYAVFCLKKKITYILDGLDVVVWWLRGRTHTGA